MESQVETAIVSIPKHGAIESPPVGCDPSDVREPGPIVHIDANFSLVTNIDVFLVSHPLGHCDVSFAGAVSHCGVARANPSVRGRISHLVAVHHRRRTCPGAYVSALMKARPSHAAGRSHSCFRRRSRLSAHCALLRSFRFDRCRAVSLLAPTL